MGDRSTAGSEARFLFLHSAELEPTVLDSQVVDSIVALANHGIQFDMAILLHGEPYFRSFSYTRRRQREIAERIGGSVRVYLTPQKMKPIGDAIGTAELAFELLRGGRRRTVIHARGDTSGFYASQMVRLGLDARFIYDVRGDIEAEFLYNAKDRCLDERSRRERLEGIEKHRSAALRHASHVWCVSSVLRDRLERRYGCDSGRMSVVPCVADERKFHVDDTDRETTRRELGLDGKFVVVFPGRLGRWHCGAEMLVLMQALMKASDDVFFLVLTPDVEEGRQMAAEMLPAGSYDVRSVPHAEVPRFLRAADLGLLLRARDPLNEVACPTKFGEYVLSGLPALISDGIGDCSGFVSANDAGAVLSALDPDAAVKAMWRIRSEPAAARRTRIASLSAPFSRGRAAAEMAAVYQRLAVE